LLYEIFGGASRTDANNSQWLRIHSPHGFSLRHLATNLSQVAWRSEWISPLVVPLAALAWLAPGRRRRLAFPLFAFFAYVIAAWWLCTHRIDRFWIPALPVIAILAGFGATWSASVAWRRMLLATLVCGLAVNWLFVISGPGGYNAYFVRLEQLRYDPARADYWHVYLNHNVSPGYKVLTVGDCQVFDLEMPVLYNTVFDDSVFEKIYQDQQGIPEKIHAELDRLRVSHVYVNWLEIRRYREPGNYGFPSLIDHRLFEELVAAGVFEPPLNRKRDHGQVFPVKKLDPGKDHEEHTGLPDEIRVASFAPLGLWGGWGRRCFQGCALRCGIVPLRGWTPPSADRRRLSPILDFERAVDSYPRWRRHVRQ